MWRSKQLYTHIPASLRLDDILFKSYINHQFLSQSVHTEVEHYFLKRTSYQPNQHTLKSIVFDMDGTLTVPVMDFAKLRKDLGIEHGRDILDVLDHMESGEEKTRLEKILIDFETEAQNRLLLQNNLLPLFQYLRIHKQHIKIGLLTRNNNQNVDYFHSKFKQEFETLIQNSKENTNSYELFDFIVTRDLKPHKPNPESLQHLASRFQIDVKEILFVGDSQDDLKLCQATQCKSCLIASPTWLPVHDRLVDDFKPDYIVSDMSQLYHILECEQIIS